MAPKKSAKSAAQQVDAQLERYRSMRDFEMTAEPCGDEAETSKKTKQALPFVIQKHAATRLHYDFRPGWRGVLKSWAVARGPSYYPGDKRLAVEVEDHPVAYGGFEGTIPKGQYGGGTVMVWDQGTWEPLVNVDEGLRTGRLKFTLHGKKMKGNWALVRMGGKAARESKPNWLLIKEHDKFERPADAEPITEEAPDSAITGRTMEQIASAEDHVWQSKKSSAPSPARSRLVLRRKPSAEGKKSQSVSAHDWLMNLEGTPREALPAFLAPQLASTVTSPPPGDTWLHELKLDGYRIQPHVSSQKRGAGKVVLYSRNGLDWTHRMPEIARELAALPVKAAVLDGEVVVFDEKGRSDFAALQSAFEDGKRVFITYVVFDLLHLDGHNLRALALEQRKQILKSLLGEQQNHAAVRYSEHVRAGGAAMFGEACRLGAEGVVSKLAGGKYIAGRTRDWVKSKCVHQQEFVIGGFTLPSGNGSGIGALLLAWYRDGELIYAGRTGTGFTQASRRHLRKKLDSLRTARSPFSEPLSSEAERGAIWVRPELVAQISFASWTTGGMVRQAAFQGLREDKAAKEVVREESMPIAKPERETKRSKAPRSVRPTPQSKHTGSPVEVEGVRITSPEKIMDNDTQLTKLQLAEYYAAVAKTMLSHIARRPLSLVRCPEGSGKSCFFQKHAGAGLPQNVGSVAVRSKSSGATEQYITLDNAHGLIELAQMGVLEIHPWGSRNNALETPDRIIFDLDPGDGIAWEQLIASALEVRGLLVQLSLESFVKSTGGKGIHVVAPIKAEHAWTQVKEFAHSFVQMMAAANPKLYLTKMTKAERGGRIYLDYLRNERGATAIAPYSSRARKGAPVAMPLAWAELKTNARPDFAVANFAQWKSRLGRDPWAAMEISRQRLTAHAIRAVSEFAA